MKRSYRKIGDFSLTSPNVRVSDPCYDSSVWCCGEISNCLTGRWEAAVVYYNGEQLGTRVSLLAARHANSGRTFAMCDWVRMDEKYVYYMNGWEICNFEVGVDSGQAGIFDSAHYQEDGVFGGMPGPEHDFGSTWYNHCCDVTLGDQQAGVIPYGAVSSSGFGDGCYTALQHKNGQGQVDCIMILFLPEENSRS